MNTKRIIFGLLVLFSSISTFSQTGTAQNDSVTVFEGKETPIDVVSNDIVFPSDILYISIPPRKGTARVKGRTVYYTSNVNVNGIDSFQYEWKLGPNPDKAWVFVRIYSYPDNVDRSAGGCLIPTQPTNGDQLSEMKMTGLGPGGYLPLMPRITPIAGDIDGDGIVEVLAAQLDETTSDSRVYGRNIQVINAVTGALKTRINTPVIYANSTTPYATADIIPNIPGAEIVVATAFNNNSPADAGQLILYSNTGTEIWRSTYCKSAATEGGAIAIADMNHDGNAEIVIQNKVFDGRTGKLLVDGDDFGCKNVGNSAMPGTSFNSIVNLADVTGDLNLEIIAGSEIYAVDLKNNTMRLLVQAKNDYGMSDGVTAIADINGDGVLDVVVIHPVTADWGGGFDYLGIYAYDSKTGNDIGNLLRSQAYAYPDQASFIPAIADLDGNDLAEIVAVFPNNGTYSFEYDQASNTFVQKWNTPGSSDIRGTKSPTVFDLNSNGFKDVLYQDLNDFRVYDGKTGAQLYKAVGRSIDGSVSCPIIVDANGNGSANIYFFGTNDNNGAYNKCYLRGFESKRAGATAYARPVWNQQGYFSVHINDNLTVPQFQFPMEHQMGGCGSPFNEYMTQQTMLRSTGCPTWRSEGFDLAFATGYPDFTKDASGNMVVTAQVRNLGNIVYPAQTANSVAFYGDGVLIHQEMMNQNVPPHGYVNYSWTLPATSILGYQQIEVVLGDQGDGTFVENECDYTNNHGTLNLAPTVAECTIAAENDTLAVFPLCRASIALLANDSVGDNPIVVLGPHPSYVSLKGDTLTYITSATTPLYDSVTYYVTDNSGCTDSAKVYIATLVLGSREGLEGSYDAYVSLSLPPGIVFSSPIVTPFTLSGTAQAGVRYIVPTPQEVTINPGETTDTCWFRIIDDNILQPTQNIIVKWTIPCGINTVVNVLDDDSYNPQGGANIPLSIDSSLTGIREGSSTLMRATIENGKIASSTIRIVLSYPINYSNTNPARKNVDYIMSSDTIVILAGQNYGTVLITALMNDVYDSTRLIQVKGTLGTPYTLQNPTASVRIIDKDAAPNGKVPLTFSVDNAEIQEGDSTPVRVTLTNALSTNIPLISTISITGGSATNGIDYTLSAQTITIDKGKRDGFVWLKALTDNLFEGDEDVELTARSTYASVMTDSVQTVVIKDAQSNLDGGADLTLSIPDTVKRGDSIPVVVSLAPGVLAGVPLGVHLIHPTSGSAADTSDYRLLDTMTIQVGQNSDTLWLKAIDKGTIEGDKLLGIQGVVFGSNALMDAFQSVVIVDNITSADLYLQITQHYIVEGDTTLIYAELGGGVKTPSMFQVDLTTPPFGATAHAGDYTLSGNVLTFAPNSSVSDTVTLAALEDNIYEETQWVIVKANVNNPLFILHNSPDTVYIANKDTTNGGSNLKTTINITFDKDTVAEGDAVRVDAKLPGTTIAAKDIIINFSRDPNSTAQDSDYMVRANHLIIPAGSNSAFGYILAVPNPDSFSVAKTLMVEGIVADTGLLLSGVPDTIYIINTKGALLHVDHSMKEGDTIPVCISLSAAYYPNGLPYPLTITLHTPYIPASPDSVPTANYPNDYKFSSTVMTIKSNSMMSDTVYIIANEDNLFEETENFYLNATLTAGGNPPIPLVGVPQEINILNVDTSGGVSNDTTKMTMHIVKHRLKEGDSTTVSVKLPGTTVAGKDVKIALEHYNVTKSIISGAKVAVDYLLTDTLVIHQGKNSSDQDPVGVNNFKSVKDSTIVQQSLILINASINSTSLVQIDSTPDSILVYPDTIIPINLAFDSTSIVEGDVCNLFASLPSGFTAGYDITLDLIAPYTGSVADSSDYILANPLIIRAGSNRASVPFHARLDNKLEKTELLRVYGAFLNPADSFLSLVDTAEIDIVNKGGNSEKIKLYTPILDVKEGDSIPVFAALPISYVAGDSIQINLTHPNGGSASAADYTLGNTLWLLPNESVSDTIYLKALQDTIYEPTETVILNGTVPPWILYGVPDTVNILNTYKGPADDTTQITLQFADKVLHEGDTTMITASLPDNYTTKNDLTIALSDEGSSAIYGVNYTAASTITIPAGAHSASIPLIVLPDLLVGEQEYVRLTGGLVTPDPLVKVVGIPDTLTIEDVVTDSVILVLDTNVVNEGGRVAVHAELTGTRNAGLDLLIHLQHPLTGTAIEDEDYTLSSVLMIRQGTQQSNTIYLNALEDSIYELPESVYILGKITNSTLVNMTSIPSLVTILNVDTTNGAYNTITPVNIEVANHQLKEGDSTTVTASLPGVTTAGDAVVIDLLHPSVGTLMGTATELIDYSLPHTLVIPVGAHQASITLVAHNDNIIEKTESIYLDGSVTSDTAVALTGIPDSVFILDQTYLTHPLVFKIDQTQLYEGESTPVYVEIANGGTAGEDLQFNLMHPQEGTAMLNADYTLGFSLTIPKGSAQSQKLTLNALTDNLYEPTETVIITAASLDLYPIQQATQTVSILNVDNSSGGGGKDSTILTITLNPDSVYEGGIAYVTASLPSGVLSGNNLDILLAHPGAGTAKDPTNYSLGYVIQIPAGMNSASSILYTRDDYVIDTTKTVIIHAHKGVVDSTLKIHGDPVTEYIQDVTRDSAKITLVVDQHKVKEGEQTGVHVELTDGITSAKDIVVHLQHPSGGTATVADYTLINTLTIPAGKNSSDTVPFTALEDNLYEPTESVIIATSVTSSPTLAVSNPLDTIYILNVDTTNGVVSDSVQVAMSIDKDTVKEGDSAMLTVSLPGTTLTGEAVTFNLQSPSVGALIGTATSADYTLPNTVTIPAGAHQASVTFAALNDKIVEPIESVYIGASTASIADSMIVLTGTPDSIFILDQTLLTDSLSLVVDPKTIYEGEQSAVYASFSGGVVCAEDLLIDLKHPQGGTATLGADYTLGTQLKLSKGQVNSDTLYLNALLDDIYENPETVNIAGTVQGGKIDLKNNPATVTILNVDTTSGGGGTGALPIQMIFSHDTIFEGEAVKITAKLPGNTTPEKDLIIKIDPDFANSVVPSSQTSYSPYIIIPAGKNMGVGFLEIHVNTVDYGLRTLPILASCADTGVAVLGVPHTLYIKDLNGVALFIPDSIREGQTLPIYAHLSDSIVSNREIQITLEVPYATTNPDSIGTATGADYHFNKYTLTIPSGSHVSDTIQFSALYDNIYEQTENLFVDASMNFTGAGSLTLFGVPAQIFIINVDTSGGVISDSTAVTIAVAHDTIAEMDSTTVTASLPRGIRAGQDVVISLQHPDVPPLMGTATRDLDYTLASQIIIRRGQNTSLPLVLNALGDSIWEPTEHLYLSGKPSKADRTLYLKGVPDSVFITNVDTTGGEASDTTYISWNISPDSIVEGNAAVLTASLPGVTTAGKDITILLTAPAPGSTAGHLDFVMPLTLVIPKGEHQSSVQIKALHDNIIEPVEILFVKAQLPLTPGLALLNDIDSLYIIDATRASHPIELMTSDSTVAEGDSIEVYAKLPEGITTSTPIVVNLTHPNGGTASYPDDYLLEYQVTIDSSANESNKIPLKAVLDDIWETPESVIIKAQIADTSFSVIGSPKTVMILNSGTSFMHFSILPSDSMYKGDTLYLRAALDGTQIAGQAIGIALDKIGGTAQWNIDYDLPLRFKIDSGQHYVDVPMIALNDHVAKDTRTIIINEATFYTASAGTGIWNINNTLTSVGIPDTAYILDTTKVSIKLLTSATSVKEGDSIQVYVQLQKGWNAGYDIPVNLTHPNAGTAALGAHYTLGNLVTIPKGANSSNVIYLTALNDTIYNPDETVIINGNSSYGNLLNAPTTVTIINQDTSNGNVTPDVAVVNISLSAHQLIEGEVGQLTAQLNGGMTTKDAIVIDLTHPNGGEAQYGLDYLMDSTITIPAGKGMASIPLTTLQDNIYETPERINIDGFINDPNILLQGLPDVVTILNNDTTAGGGGADSTSIQITFSQDSIFEGDFSLITASLPGTTVAAHNIIIKLQGGLVGTDPTITTDDYRLSSEIIIRAGHHSAEGHFHAELNMQVNPDRPVVIGATVADPGLRIHGVPHPVVIKDLQGVILVMPDTIREGDTMAVFAEFTDGASLYGRDVKIALSPYITASPDSTSTATYNTDYSFLGDTLTIQSGERWSNYVFLVAKSDNVYQPTRNFFTTGSVHVITGVAPTLLGIPAQTYILNVDTSNGGNSDYVGLEVQINKDQVEEGDSANVLVKLPGAMTTEKDLMVLIQHPSFESYVGVANRGDYRLVDSLLILAGSNSSSAINMNLHALHNSMLEVPRILYVGVPDQEDPYLVGLNVDSTYIVSAKQGVSLHFEMDSILEGNTTHLIASLPAGVRAGHDIVITLTHPVAPSVADASDYQLANQIIIGKGDHQGSIPFTALMDNQLEVPEVLYVQGDTPAGDSFLMMANPVDSIVILDNTGNNGVINLVTYPIVYEGDSIPVYANLMAGIVAGQDIPVVLKHPGVLGTATVNVDYTLDTVCIIQKGQSVSSEIELKALTDHLYEVPERVDIAATSLFPVVNEPQTVYIHNVSAAGVKDSMDVAMAFNQDTVREGQTAYLNFQLLLGNIAADSVVIELIHPAGGTASASDYTLPTRAVIAPMASSISVPFYAVPDSILENSVWAVVKGSATPADPYLSVSGSPDSIEILDATPRINMSRLVVGADSVMEGDRIPVYMEMNGLTSTQNIQFTLQHPGAGSVAQLGIDYTLGTQLTIPADSARSNVLWLHALSDLVYEEPELLIIHANLVDTTWGTVSNTPDSVYILNQTHGMPQTVIDLSVEKHEIWEGQSTKIFAHLPLGYTSSKDLRIHLTHPLGLGTPGCIDPSDYTLDTVIIIPKGKSVGSLVLKTTMDTITQPQRHLIFKAQLESTDPYLSLNRTQDTIYIDNFSGVKLVVSHDSVKEGSHVDVYAQFIDPTAIAPLDFDVHLDHPLAGSTADPVNDYSLGDLLHFTKGSMISEIIPLDAILDNVQEPTETVIIGGEIRVPFATPNIPPLKGVPTTVYIINQRDTTDTGGDPNVTPITITFDTTRVAEGHQIVIRAHLPLGMVAGEIIPIHFYQIGGTGDASDFEVDTLVIPTGANGGTTLFKALVDVESCDTCNQTIELQAEVVSPDTTLQLQGVPETITILPSAINYTTFSVNAQVDSIDYHPSCTNANTNTCAVDRPYFAPYLGLDGEKNVATIIVRVDSLLDPTLPLAFQVAFAGTVPPSMYTLDGLVGDTALIIPAGEYSASFHIICNLPASSTLHDSMLITVKAGVNAEAVPPILFSNDFDEDGLSNEAERDYCVKTTNGIFNEWYYHSPDGDADGDGISNIVEMGGNWGDMIDTDNDCIPDWLDTDSNNDGVPDSVEKFTGNTTDSTIGIKVRPAVSPNNDNLGDDRMYIENINLYPNNTVSVFDRVGHVLYRQDGYNNKDKSFAGYPNQGNMSNKVPMGTYYYYVDYFDPSANRRYVKSGFIEIRY